MGSVIITDGLLRKSLSAVRSLGSKGIKTIVGEKSWFSPSGFSKYAKRRVKYPDPINDSEGFLRQLYELLHKENNPVLMPMDDAVMNVVMKHIDEIKEISRCLLPDKSAYDIASDKYETYKLAKEQGIECPKSFVFEDAKDIEKFGESVNFPVIIKPCKSSGSRGIRKAHNKIELIELYKKLQGEYQALMIQEFIPLGERYDVCLLYDKNHKVKAAFVQKEVRHFPINMGPSTVQESVIFQDLIDKSIKLLQSLKWSGIVEVEFMMDSRSNNATLMEINPRFWNSLDLAVQSGIDFPYLLYQLCMGNDFPRQDYYQIGRRSRWLFPGDLLHFLMNPKRLSMDPPLFAGRKLNLFDDTFSRKDPFPGLVFLITCLRFTLSSKTWKMFLKR
ncbi:MAG: ATP-grasp domain-containing protein [Heyndrickxia sp.]